MISTRNTIAAHADKDSAMIVLQSGYPFQNEAGEKIQLEYVMNVLTNARLPLKSSVKKSP